MKPRMSVCGLAAAVSAIIFAGNAAVAQQSSMTFFLTSAGPGKGADLGGLEGADKHCQKLAEAAGAGKHTWRAYLSASAAGDTPAVNARDRIGKGPWQNTATTNGWRDDRDAQETLTP